MSSQLSQLSLEQIRHNTQIANQHKYPGRPRTHQPLPSEPENGIQVPPLIDRQRRHWVDGINEQALVKAFHHFRNQEGDFETGTFTRSSYPPKTLGITATLFSTWLSKEQSIVNSPKGSHRTFNTRQCTRPIMKQRLYDKFCFHRTIGKHITHRWFTRYTKEIYQDLYLLKRWYQFNRRNTIRNNNSDAGNPLNEFINNPRIGRFLLSNIANMDQTLFAFEFGSTEQSYNHKDNNIVFLKESKSRWEKCQATLQIVVSTNNIPRCKSFIIFRGVENSGNKIRQRELKKYHKGVDIIFNPKGYYNAKELLKWFKNQYKWSTMESPTENKPRLLTLDSFAAHKGQGRKIKVKESVSERQIREKSILDVIFLRQTLKDLNMTTSIIPGGTTGYIQVLDVSVNKTMKDLIRNLEEEYYDNNLEQWKAGKYSTAERRVLLTEWVGKAWVQFHEEYQSTIVKIFRHLGLSLNPDGSEDHELKIRDLPDFEIGDFSRTLSPAIDTLPILETQEEVEDEAIVTDAYTLNTLPSSQMTSRRRAFRTVTYHIVEERASGISGNFDSDNETTTCTDDDTDSDRSLDLSDFDNEMDGDDDGDDMNME
ncbi:hypothetical protein SBOR_9243 [Sclerotinia borealis F-4128]|uniref:DDE-1 domain-containing protein n=1 Tax=Sclerotinia borealis (strain F-4128) TaxID=1432307 RepID=W9C3D5_SCLBF|nr:hypothetical protein SBOR_9243 [Sclerotinia borealis F-4128]